MRHLLTKRERQAVDLIGQGMLHKQVAHELGILPTSVNNLAQSIRRKWGLTRRPERLRTLIHDHSNAELGALARALDQAE